MRRKRKHLASFVALERSTLKSPEWRRLSSSAKVLYIELKRKYNGSNNGEIKLYYSEARDMFSDATTSRAFKELKSEGWVERTKLGGMYRYENQYKLTGKHDKAIPNYGL